MKNKDLMRKYQSITDKMFNNLFDEYFLIEKCDPSLLNEEIVDIDIDDENVLLVPNKLQKLLYPLDFFSFDITCDCNDVYKSDFLRWVNKKLELNIPIELCDEFGTNLKYFKFEDREEKYFKDINEEEKENILKELGVAFEFYSTVLLKAKKEYFKEIENAKKG